MSAERALAAPATETTGCLLCGSAQSTLLEDLVDTVWSRPGSFALRRCRACGFAFLSPRPVPGSISFYYEDFYGGGELAREVSIQHGWVLAIVNRGRVRELVARRALRPGERHLDVGCGLGAFLLRLVRATGATGVGVDFDPKAIAWVGARAAEEKLPVELHAGTLAEQKLPPSSFATASMNHFLEHVYDPLDELRRVAALVAPGGAILVEVPSFHALGRRLFGTKWLSHCAPQHLSLFSRESLRAALEKAGFREVRIHDNIAPLMLTLSLIVWWRWNLGTKSRHRRNPLVWLLTIVFAITVFPICLALDLALSPLIPLLGMGEAIRATAVK
jgi:SAM-dependent methyltransferase